MRKKVIAILLAAVMLFAGTVPVSAGILSSFTKKQDTVTISAEEYNRLKKFEKMDTILQYLEYWYINEVNPEDLIEFATTYMLYQLEDPYTFYYDTESWSDLWADDEGVYGGIGLQLLGNYADYTVTVTRVFKGTPSQEAGIQRGDLLVRVEDIEVTAYTMTDAVNVMRGEAGKEVEIEICRNGEYITYRIPRAIITVNRVESAMLEDQIGYIALYEFAGESEKEFSDAWKTLKEQGAQALILDLRDNPGGWTNAAQAIADLFLDECVLVYSQDRYGTRENTMMTNGKDDVPLVILINENSASSSEILAGGLQDHGRATLVGTKSYGKGIIQSVIPLANDTCGFQMTYAEYYLSSGTKVHKIGLTPDVESLRPDDALAYYEVGDMNDHQLHDAWMTAEKLLGKEAD